MYLDARIAGVWVRLLDAARPVLSRPVVGKLVLALSAVTLFALSAEMTIGRRNHVVSGDFVAFYAAAQTLRSHPAALYDPAEQQRAQTDVTDDAATRVYPFLNPPAAAALYVPFTFLPIEDAYYVAECVEMLLLVAVAFVMWPMLGSLTRPLRWAFLAAALLNPVTFDVVAFTQLASVLLLAAVVAARVVRRDPILAGVLLGTLALKPSLVPGVAVALLILREPRVLAGFAAAVTAIVASLAVAGFDGIADYARILMDSTHAVRASAIGPTAQQGARGLAYSFGGPFAYPLFIALSAVILVLVLALLFAVRRRRIDSLAALSVALATGVVLAPHLHRHDMALLIAVAAILVGAEQVVRDRVIVPTLLLGALWLQVSVVTGLFGVSVTVVPLVAAWTFVACWPALASRAREHARAPSALLAA